MSEQKWFMSADNEDAQEDYGLDMDALRGFASTTSSLDGPSMKSFESSDSFMKIIDFAPDWTDTSSSFTTRNSPLSIMDTIASAFEQHSDAVLFDISSTKHQISGSFQASSSDESDRVSFEINCWKSTNEKDYIVEFLKKRGDALDFHAFYRRLLISLSESLNINNANNFNHPEWFGELPSLSFDEVEAEAVCA